MQSTLFTLLWMFEKSRTYFETSDQRVILLLAISLLTALFVMPAMIGFGLQHAQTLRELQEQLASFSLRAAQCTCCTVDHCDPSTGNQLLCDRTLIFQTLKRWYPSSSGNEDHLSRFDTLVKERLKNSVLQILGPGVPPLRYVLAMCGPAHFALLPQLLSAGASSGQSLGRTLLEYISVLAVSLLFILVSTISFRAFAGIRGLPKCALLILIECLLLASLACFVLPHEVAVASGELSDAAVAASGMWGLLLCICFGLCLDPKAAAHLVACFSFVTQFREAVLQGRKKATRKKLNSKDFSNSPKHLIRGIYASKGRASTAAVRIPLLATCPETTRQSCLQLVQSCELRFQFNAMGLEKGPLLRDADDLRRLCRSYLGTYRGDIRIIYDLCDSVGLGVPSRAVSQQGNTKMPNKQ